MCGRYALVKTGLLPELFEISEVRIPPRFNIAPTQDAPVIRLEQGQRRLDMVRWGLVPFWSRDPSMGARMINARAETVADKPAFRQAFRRRRCLIPADGFFEWKKEKEHKQPYFIHSVEKQPFAFAGLWDHWKEKEGAGSLDSFTILTCAANELVSRLHDRMPVILPRQAYGCWLDSSADLQTIGSLLQPFPADELKAYPVNRHVNNPRNDDPTCLEPAG